MDRRQFLIGSAAAVAAGAAFWSGPGAVRADTAGVPLVLGPEGPVRVPANVIGFSYETASLGDPLLFSPDNSALIALFRGLGPNGVLRIGGNSSDFADWSEDGSRDNVPAPHYAIAPSARDLRYRRTLVTGEAIRNLAGFLEATGWSLIYGLNLGTGDAANQADQAAFVASQIGARLMALQIGNEPDLFHHNGLREPSWGYADYYREWSGFASAVRARLADPPLAGPDVAYNVRWIESFAGTAQRDGIVLLTGHYYAEGPPSNPAMTVARLLAGDPRLSTEESAIMAAARQCRTPFRMAEGNTCYDGGKNGVSNVFASALWAADFILQTAQAGYSGINFHGGGYGLYTPIAGEPGRGFTARPIYYGMWFASQFAGSRLRSASPAAAGVDVSVYAASGTDDRSVIAIVNKDQDSGASIQVDLPQREGIATVSRLTAPSATAQDDVSFGGASAAPGMVRLPIGRSRRIGSGGFAINVPPASAVLLTVRGA